MTFLDYFAEAFRSFFTLELFSIFNITFSIADILLFFCLFCLIVAPILFIYYYLRLL